MYHYLTGAASWYMLTAVTEVFGVHGETGDMVIRPRLLGEQFDAEGNAGLWLRFAQKKFHVRFKNPLCLTYGEYAVKSAVCDGNTEFFGDGDCVSLSRETIASLTDELHEIEVELERK